MRIWNERKDIEVILWIWWMRVIKKCMNRQQWETERLIRVKCNVMLCCLWCRPKPHKKIVYISHTCSFLGNHGACSSLQHYFLISLLFQFFNFLFFNKIVYKIFNILNVNFLIKFMWVIIFWSVWSEYFDKWKSVEIVGLCHSLWWEKRMRMVGN